MLKFIKVKFVYPATDLIKLHYQARFRNTSGQSLRLHLIGDSMMERSFNYGYPRSGWGEPFLHEFKKSNISVLNYAKGGASTKSFIKSGRWKFALSGMRKNDYILIGLCHNDESIHKPPIYSSPQEFEINILKMVEDVLGINAIPILATPVPLYDFKNDTFIDSHQNYIQVLKSISNQRGIKLIDIYEEVKKMMMYLGQEKSKSLFNIQLPGIYKNYPNGVIDKTHLNINGAKAIAQIAFALTKSIIYNDI